MARAVARMHRRNLGLASPDYSRIELEQGPGRVNGQVRAWLGDQEAYGSQWRPLVVLESSSSTLCSSACLQTKLGRRWLRGARTESPGYGQRRRVAGVLGDLF